MREKLNRNHEPLESCSPDFDERQKHMSILLSQVTSQEIDTSCDMILVIYSSVYDTRKVD